LQNYHINKEERDIKGKEKKDRRKIENNGKVPQDKKT